MGKRQFKFITSILSLVLMVSLLIMGAYSMIKRQVTISGTISFVSTGVKLEYELYTTSSGDKDGFSFRGAESLEAIPYNKDPAAIIKGFFDAANKDDAEADLGAININDLDNSFAFKLYIKSNETSNIINLANTLPEITQEDTTLRVFKNDFSTEVTSQIESNQLEFQIEPEEDVNLHYLFTVNGFPEDFSGLDIASKFVFSKGTAITPPDLTYTLNEDEAGYTIKAANITEEHEHLVIPNMYKELPVVAIGDGAFALQSYLKTVSIPDTVTRIGDYAFGHSGLTQLTIGKNVTEIGINPFIYIGADGFLTGDFILNNSIDLTVESGNTHFKVIDGMLINIADKKIISYVGQSDEVTIPNDIEVVGATAFASGETIANITIPNSVKIIEDYAFAGNTLTNITIPSSVTSIGEYVFVLNHSEEFHIIWETTTDIPINMFYMLDHFTSLTITSDEDVVKIYDPAGFLRSTDLNELYFLFTNTDVLNIYVPSTNLIEEYVHFDEDEIDWSKENPLDVYIETHPWGFLLWYSQEYFGIDYFEFKPIQ